MVNSLPKWFCRLLIWSFSIFLSVFFYSKGYTQDQPDSNHWIFNDQSLPEIQILIDPDSLNQLFQEQNWYSDHEYPATFVFMREGVYDTVENIGFRIRGNTSRASAKKSFKVSFNTFQAGRQYYGLDKLNLNGENNDPSIIRSKLSWDIFREMGVKASRANHVKVFINGTFYGLYINVEHIDDEFVQKNFSDDSGNLFKCLWPADLTYRGTSVEAYKFESGGRRTYDLKTNEDEDNYTDLANFIIFLNRSSDEEFAEEIEDYIHVDGILQWMAVDILTSNWDNYWFLKNNFYLYQDPQTDRFVFIPYDYDNTFGIWWDGISPGIDWGKRDLTNWGHPTEDRPLTSRILTIERYRKRLHYYVQQTMKFAFNEDRMFSEIDRLKTLTQRAAEEDMFRVYDYNYTIQDYHDSFLEALGGHVTYGLKPYIVTRIQSAENLLQIEDIDPVVRSVQHQIHRSEDVSKLNLLITIVDEAEVDITVEMNGDLYSNTMLNSDSSAIPGIEQIYSIDIELPDSIDVIKFHVTVSDQQGNQTRYPFNPSKTIDIEFQRLNKTVLINEFVADNKTGIQDDSGKYEDWIELFNPTDQDVVLKGFYLTDDITNPVKWALPDTTISSGSYVLIWADNDDEEGPLHTNFGLSKDGEEIGLFFGSENPELIDSVRFGPQFTDRSFGRKTDGADEFIFFDTPTPGSENVIITSNLPKAVIPTQFELDQNFPNPFNPTTIIRYRLPFQVKVTLSIYSVTGQHIHTLVDQVQNGGVHEITFSADGLSTGVYYYQLKTSEFTVSRLMSIIK